MINSKLILTARSRVKNKIKISIKKSKIYLPDISVCKTSLRGLEENEYIDKFKTHLKYSKTD